MKAVLFDLDNTLIDFMEMKRMASEAAIEAMIKAGLKMNKEEALKTLYSLYEKHGIEHQNILDEFLKHVHNGIDYKILAAGILAYRHKKSMHLTPYPGVKPTLEELRKRGYKLAIVSDARKIQVYMRLTEMGLVDSFDTIVGLDDTGERKPSALPFKKALDKLGLPPEEVLHVGDWPDRDIAGAKALGMKAALAKYGLTGNKPITVQPDYELNKIEELLELL